MTSGKYSDPGTDPAYCDPLAPELEDDAPEDGELAERCGDPEPQTAWVWDPAMARYVWRR